MNLAHRHCTNLRKIQLVHSRINKIIIAIILCSIINLKNMFQYNEDSKNFLVRWKTICEERIITYHVGVIYRLSL